MDDIPCIASEGDLIYLFVDKLKGSRFTTDDDISAMMEYFDGTTKPTFRDPAAKAYIRFGGPRDTDANYGIKRGVLTLPGYAALASIAHEPMYLS